jgi:atypical dual specificity phosphatase
MAHSIYGVSQVTEIIPSLYLTSVYGATRENIVKKGASLLVNAAQELPKQEISGVESIKLFLDDTPYALINVYFDRISEKIHDHLNRGGRAVIHCVLGVSRSTSLVLAYLMKYKNMSLKHAFEMVSSKRPCVRPNPGFWRQLIDYEKRIKSVPSTKIDTNSLGLNGAGASSNIYKTETSIPITIISSSSNISRRPSFSGNSSNDVVVSSSRPFSATRLGSARNYNDYTNSSNRSSSNFSKIYSQPATSYISPSTQHRTSYIVNDDLAKYSKPLTFSTTYRSSYGRY